MRLVVGVALLIISLVRSGPVESLNNETLHLDNVEDPEIEEMSEFDYAVQDGINVTEQERFCLNISEQLNATKHRGFLHGFCNKTFIFCLFLF